MAYYSYYQNSQPTAWGTQQYQYVAPPMPQYQPQPSWHGGDYYRAHADSAENTLFDYAWSKMKNLVGGAGLGRSEATHWWKRVYGGTVSPSKLLPRELGAAAGYEAIRFWEHQKAIYFQPLSGDREREREALIGLATAEVAKLWPYTLRPRDKYGRMEASEVAAETACRIFNKSYDYDSSYESYRRSPRSRRRSISAVRYGNGISDDEYLDDDDDDDDMLDERARTDYLDAYPRRSRSQRLRPALARRSSSVYRRSPSPYGRTSSPYGRRSPSPYGRRSPSPMGLGLSSSGVGLSTTAVYPAQYSSSSTAGIPGTYYPQATTAVTGYGYPQATGGYGSYSPVNASPYGSALNVGATSPYGGMGGASPYMNRAYAGSSVGLPPPPGGGYLAAPGALGHHRSRSAGSYGAVRPVFQY